MRKLYRSWNSLYLQNLLSFLADVQKLRCFLKKKKKQFSFMVSPFIFTSSLNRKLVLRNCSYVSPFIFLANVWVEVKTSCQNVFRVSLRSFRREIPARAGKSDQKEANLV